MSSTGVRMSCRLPGAVMEQGEPGGAVQDWWQCRKCADSDARARRIADRRAWDAAYRRQREYLSKPHETQPVPWDALTRGK